MRVAIVRGGGVAGIASRTQLHADALSAEDAQALVERVERAGLLTRSEQSAPPPVHADESRYAVTVREDDAERTLHFSEATLPEPVRELIAWVDAHPAREQEIVPPGG